MKKIFILILIIVTILASALSALAADVTPSIKLNGTQLAVKGVVQENTLYLPLRPICERLGYTVTYSQPFQTITIKSKTKTILLNLKLATISVNNHESYAFDGPKTINGTSYMGSDFYLETLALRVLWVKKTNTVTLTSIKENAITITNVKTASKTKALVSTVQYPVLGGLTDKTLQAKLNGIFKGFADSAAKEGVQNAIDIADYVKENPDMPGVCETYFNYQVTYNQKDMISIVFRNYQYAGGAHGGTVQTSYTYNIKTGQLYALKDIFKTGYDYVRAINNSVKLQLAERELTDVLFEPFKTIRSNHSYFLSNNGVVVYFQQYEILPYSEGIQEFTLDYTNLGASLK